MKKNHKTCPICGRQFPSPPSDKTVTCSPACRSERARRAVLARGGASVLHSAEANQKMREERARRKQEHPEQLQAMAKRASDAALQNPENQRGGQHRFARRWLLVDPDGRLIEVESLSHWARENYRLFEPDSTDPEKSAARIRAGFQAISRSLAGTIKEPQRPSFHYKGWGMLAPSREKSKE